MVPSPGTCEIVEAEELDSVGRLKETRLSSFESKLDESGKSSMLKLKHKYSLEDELNQLFEAIDLRMQTRGSGSARQSGTDSSQKVASKKPIRIGVSQASGIGISESVTLKQALRKVCISHASEMAATKRLSKSVGSSGVSEAGTIKRLYRAVVVEASESGLRPDEGKGSLVEISLVPEKSTLDLSNKIPESFQAPKEDSSTHSFPSAVATATELSLAETQTQDETVSLPTEAGKEESTMKLKQEVKLKSALSPSSLNIPSNALELDEAVSASTEVGSNTSMPDLVQNVQPQCSPSPSNSNTASTVKKSSINSSCLLKPVFRNKCFSKKKVKQDPAYTCSSSNTCIEDGKSDLGSSTSKLVCPTHYCNENITKEYASQASINASPNVEGCSGDADSGANKPCFSSNNYDAKASESSISREKGSSSQSSKSTMCGYRSSISISDETSSRGSSYSGSRPHMSKDLRWDAIHRVEMQHGTIGLRHFKLLKRLGCGDIGTVYLAELTGTECLFAVKVMDTEFLASRKKTIRARTEREILQMLDHPFLPTLFAHFTTDKFSCLVMEYCPGGDLHILRQKQPGGSFTEQEARFYVAEILLALEYLHMLGVVYRDLKPENILVREDGHIMLSDFDLSLRCTVRPTLIKTSSSIKEPSKRVSAPCMESTCIHPFFLQPSCVLVPCLTPRRASAAAKTQKLKPVLRAKVPQLLAEPTSARSNSFVGTHEYLAPEIIKGEGHGNAVDWWTFGIFLYELLFGKTPFKGLGNEDTLVNVVMHSVKFPASPSVSSQAKDLIRGLLVKEPEDRLGSVRGAAEIRQHPFFEGLNWALIRCAIPPMLPKSCDPVLSLVSEENKPIEGQSGEENSEFGQF